MYRSTYHWLMTISAHSQYRHCQYHIVVATSLWSSQTPWLPWLSWLPWWPPSSSSSSSSSAAAAAAASTPSTQASTTSTSAFQCHPNHWHRLLLVFVEAAPCQLHPVSLQGLRAATLRSHVIQVSFKYLQHLVVRPEHELAYIHYSTCI